MALAGIELRYLADTITKETDGYYVSNIHGISRGSLLFKLHHPEKPDIMLMISTLGIWMSGVRIEGIEPNRLLRRLRSDLLRLRISGVRQVGAERIAYVTFSGFGREFVLIAEFFSGGNMILCSAEHKILALAHSVDVRHRKLAVGLEYIPPPQDGTDIFAIDREGVRAMRSSGITAGRWIGRTLGLPARYVQEIIRRAGISPDTPCGELSESAADSIYESVNGVISDVVGGRHEPVLVEEKDGAGAYPISMGDTCANYKSMPSFMEALDAAFTSRIVEEGAASRPDKAAGRIAELEHRLNEQQGAVSTVIERSESIAKVAGAVQDMITGGAASLEGEAAAKNLATLGASIISEKGVSKMIIGDTRITLEPGASLYAIASALFDESKKQSGAVDSIEKQMKKTRREIARLEGMRKTPDAISVREIRRKNWYERYRWFYTSDGLLAVGGRDAASNASVIRKHMENDDIVFHAEIFGSPFFILKDGSGAPYTSIAEVAQATVSFSRAWRESMHGTSAYWVNPGQVKRSAPTGEFLPKGSFTIEGRRNVIKTGSLRLAVGMMPMDGGVALSCGPVAAVGRQSPCYAIIEPGGLSMTDAARKIRGEFLKKMEDETKELVMDDFVRVIPAGDSQIKEVREGGAGDAGRQIRE